MDMCGQMWPQYGFKQEKKERRTPERTYSVEGTTVYMKTIIPRTEAEDNHSRNNVNTGGGSRRCCKCERFLQYDSPRQSQRRKIATLTGAEIGGRSVCGRWHLCTVFEQKKKFCWSGERRG
jgi:hypothetical protein